MGLRSTELAAQLSSLDHEFHHAKMKAGKAQHRIDKTRGADAPADDAVLKRREAERAEWRQRADALGKAVAQTQTDLDRQLRWESERTHEGIALVYEDADGALRAKWQDTGEHVRGVTGVEPGAVLLTVLIDDGDCTTVLSAEPAPATRVFRGIVQNWIDNRAFGIITLLGGETIDGRDTVLFHKTHTSVDAPAKDMYVQFKVSVKRGDASQWWATDVEPASEAPIPEGDWPCGGPTTWNWYGMEKAQPVTCACFAQAQPSTWDMSSVDGWTYDAGADGWIHSDWNHAPVPSTEGWTYDPYYPGATQTAYSNPYAPVHEGPVPECFQVAEHPCGDY